MQKIIHERYDRYTDKMPFLQKSGINCVEYDYSTEVNWHENIEIQIVTDGEGISMIDGKKYEVKKDDILVINSNALHSTFTYDNLLYNHIIINEEWCRRMNIDYKTLNFCSLIRYENIKSLICELEYIYVNREDVMRIAKANAVLLQLMLELFDKYCKVQGNSSTRSKYANSVVSAIEFIYNNYNQRISLSDIAKSVLLDKYALCREFKKYTGYTIFEYINRYRSLKAMDFLTKGYSVAETAELCGFGDVSYFTQSFKKHIGKSPSQYKGNTHV